MEFSKLPLPPSPTRFCPPNYLCYDPHFTTLVHHCHYNFFTIMSSPKHWHLSLPLTKTPLTICHIPSWLLNPYLLHLLPIMLPRPLSLFTNHPMHPLHPSFIDQPPQHLSLITSLCYSASSHTHTPFLPHSAPQNCNQWLLVARNLLTIYFKLNSSFPFTRFLLNNAFI